MLSSKRVREMENIASDFEREVDMSIMIHDVEHANLRSILVEKYGEVGVSKVEALEISKRELEYAEH